MRGARGAGRDTLGPTINCTSVLEGGGTLIPESIHLLLPLQHQPPLFPKRNLPLLRSRGEKDGRGRGRDSCRGLVGEQHEVAGVEGLLNLAVQSEHARGLGLGVGSVERCFLVHVGGDPCAEATLTGAECLRRRGRHLMSPRLRAWRKTQPTSLSSLLQHLYGHGPGQLSLSS